jgi:hypothetical protein
MSRRAGCDGEQSDYQSDYQSYLLRLWRVNGGEEGWRASLESAHAGGRRGFADLEALFGFLRRQTSQRPIDLPGEGAGNEEGKERRWSSDSVYQRFRKYRDHRLRIWKSGKEGER